MDRNDNKPQTCPHCLQTKPAGRVTSWCLDCWRAWLADYPANVRGEYAEVCQRVFGAVELVEDDQLP